MKRRAKQPAAGTLALDALAAGERAVIVSVDCTSSAFSASVTSAFDVNAAPALMLMVVFVGPVASITKLAALFVAASAFPARSVMSDTWTVRT